MIAQNLRPTAETIQNRIAYSKEGQLAEKGLISYSTALLRASLRKEAFALAKPHSAVTIAYGNSYLYQDGVLCYFRENIIRILEVHKTSETETVIDLKCLLLYDISGWEDEIETLRNITARRFAVNFSIIKAAFSPSWLLTTKTVLSLLWTRETMPRR